MAVTRFNELQLQFDLPDLDEVAGDAEDRMISPEEARLISEAARKGLEARASIGPIHADGRKVKEPGWYRDYLRLIEQGWPWRVACYMAWASSPKVERWPARLNDLAKDVLGLKSARVIYTWRKNYPSLDTIVGMMQGAPLWEHRRDVLDALVEMASKPDYKSHNDRKLFLEMTGDYTPKSMLGVGKAGKSGEIVEMSDDALRLWAGEGIAEPADRSEMEKAGNDEDGPDGG